MEIVDNQKKEERSTKRYSIQDLEDFAVKFYQTSPTGYTQSSIETIKLVDTLRTEISNNKISMDNIKDIVIEGFKQNSKEHHEIRESQVKALENKADQKVVDDLKELTSQKADKETVAAMKENLEKINSNINRLVWTILIGVLGVAGTAILLVIEKLY